METKKGKTLDLVNEIRYYPQGLPDLEIRVSLAGIEIEGFFVPLKFENFCDTVTFDIEENFTVLIKNAKNDWENVVVSEGDDCLYEIEITENKRKHVIKIFKTEDILGESVEKFEENVKRFLKYVKKYKYECVKDFKYVAIHFPE